MTQSSTEPALQEAIDNLSRSHMPARDLWPGIAYAINEERFQLQWRHAALAASVLLVLVTSLFFGRLQPTSAQEDTALQNLIMGLASEHQASKQALLVEYRGQQPLYSGWENQMQQLEQAEQVIYKSLREEPGNMELLKILRQIQQKQLKLIDSAFDSRMSSI